MGSVFLASARARQRSLREEGEASRERKLEHQSVMVKEVVELLAPKKGEVVVDATYGVGGHSRALKAEARITLIGIDADPGVVNHPGGEEVSVGNFSEVAQVLRERGHEKADKFLFDLGWNRTQLGAGKGFSFQNDEPLLMSYGDRPASGFTAQEILNGWSEKVLADVFFGYGEERYARRIAKAVVERRALMPISTTRELVEIISDAVPASYRHGRLHFATRTFQALRIAVNDEFKVLETGLRAAWGALSCGGRIAVITFHSSEDRIVKRLFLAFAKEEGKLLVKKPLVASPTEIKHNPASRSAKLRAIEKICNV